MKFPCFKKTMSLFLGVLITLGVCSAATIGASAAKGYEYCVQNVKAIEKTDDMVVYEKIKPNDRMDLFDASVFACCKFLDRAEKEKAAAGWWS